MNKLELFRELIERSQNENRGLTVYFGGQSIVGVVARVIGEEAIELRSQQYHKALVLFEAVDAMTVS